MIRYAVIVGIAGLLVGASGKTERFELENGLDVMIRPVEGARQVALVTLFSLGGDHDPEGKCGLAHLVEHLYITAAAGEGKARNVTEYMKMYPDGWNAQTGDDYTVFAAVFHGGRLREEIQDAAARMGDLRITPSDLAREKPRLLQEIASMFERVPSLAAHNQATERVRPTPNGGRRGGVAAEVESTTVEEVQDRWKKLYKPANAILVLAGAIDPVQVKKAITDAFGEIPPGEEVPPAGKPMDPRLGEVDTIPIEPIRPGARPVVGIAYRVPIPSEDHYPAFLVHFGRLQQKLFLGGHMQDGSLTLQYAPLDDPRRLSLHGPLKEGESRSDGIRRLEAFIAEATTSPFGGGEEATVKNHLRFFFWTEEIADPFLQNLYLVAFALGRHAQMGIDPPALDRALDDLTAEEVQEAANAIFSPARRAAVIIDQKSSD
jgi:zinc protease